MRAAPARKGLPALLQHFTQKGKNKGKGRLCTLALYAGLEKGKKEGTIP